MRILRLLFSALVRCWMCGGTGEIPPGNCDPYWMDCPCKGKE